jgi:hypothetical protein
VTTQECDHKDIKGYIDKLTEDTLGTENESKEVGFSVSDDLSWLW